MMWDRLSRLLPFIPDVHLPDMSVPQPALEPVEGQVWCPNRLCGCWRDVDVIPAIEETKLYGAVPPFTVCQFCGDWLDVKLPDEAA